jgi:hypothetical protein
LINACVAGKSGTQTIVIGEIPRKCRFTSLANPQGAPIAFWQFA